MQASLFDTSSAQNRGIHTLLNDALQYNGFGRETMSGEKTVGGISLPVYENEFWTAKQRDAHSLHEVSYRACFKPQLPRFFITRCTHRGETVLDPFMGRGTTLIEAALLGRRAIGSDLNPVCSFLTRSRLNPPTPQEIELRLKSVDLKDGESTHTDLLAFYHPQTLHEIESWRDYFMARQKNGELDKVDDWIRMVACNRLTGHSPGFFSVYTMPPNQAVSVASQRKINIRLNQEPVYRDTKTLIWKKTLSLLKNAPPNYQLEHQTSAASADNLKNIPDNCAQLIVTSPPFLDIVNYKADNWLRAWFCGIELESIPLWQEKTLANWSDKMRRAFTEWHRVLRPAGTVAFETGEIQKGQVLLEDEIIKIAHSIGFMPKCIIINTQQFTKTANCWGVENMSKGTNSNRVLVLQKSDSQ